eukprot:12146776-Ditylum_brightwellii.AAC.1
MQNKCVDDDNGDDVDSSDDEKSKENKHVIGNNENSVDGADDDSVDNGVDNGVDSSDVGANKHLTYLSQAVDCCLAKKCKQN